MKKTIQILWVFICAFGALQAQNFDSKITQHLLNKQAQLGLTNQDLSDLKTLSQSYSESMKAYTVYVNQRYQGIPVYQSTTAFAVKDGQVFETGVSFQKNVATRANTISPSLNAETAISRAAAELGMSGFTGVSQTTQQDAMTFTYSGGTLSKLDIPVQLVFQPTDNGSLRLAWDLGIYFHDASHYYSMRIDAVTGNVLAKHDLVLSCNFGSKPHAHNTFKTEKLFTPNVEANTNLVDAQYLVYPIPVESPNHGAAELITDPSDATASPFGWHDTDGAAGAEFTITRGNNVYAYDDIAGDNTPGVSADGGADLIFNFPFDFVAHPNESIEAATVNLFYLNNIMHDVWFYYGFDELSGNFQQTNYDPLLILTGNDAVDAEAQDGSGLNNANFLTLPDGIAPVMQMFLWSGAPGFPLVITDGALAGEYLGVPATFGSPLPDPSTPLTGELVLAFDDNASAESTDENDGCDTVTNAAEVAGKIAVIRRGGCEFGVKVKSVEDAGAIAAIVVNTSPGNPTAMGPGVVGDQVTIPSIMITQDEGEAIISALLDGDVMNAELFDFDTLELDGDLDNGIIAHEYGHGISNRLIGGALNTFCLLNDEQMGEGWSDWFGLILTVEPGDAGTDARGIGTYAIAEGVDGGGIRPAPYSTDFAVNDFTYGDTNDLALSAPHGVGFVWATMLWDLTWDFIDEYGYDPDLYQGTGGNNIAAQLIMDGMKLQLCLPGFVDGRNAILLADQLNNNGENQCLIWNAFARRGLGLSALQGLSVLRDDQTEAFDVPSNCQLGFEDAELLKRNFTIYPNPAQDQVVIKSLITAGTATVSVYDLNGREMLSEAVDFSSEVKLNTQNLASGVYLISIDGGAYKHTAKLIIQ